LTSRSEQQSTVLFKMNSMFEANSRFNADLAYQIADLRSSVVESVSQIKAELVRQDAESRVNRQYVESDEEEETAAQIITGRVKGIMAAGRARATGNRDGENNNGSSTLTTGSDTFFAPRAHVDIGPFATALSANVETGHSIAVTLKFLRSLHYSTLKFRYSDIPEAHCDTLRWMFSKTFSKWLGSLHPIFWISGKPGSGKSTLMKYLVDSTAEIHGHLAPWSAGTKVIVARYFFWINGTELQKSQEGLARSLLFDILRQSSDTTLARQAFPEQWQALEMGLMDHESLEWTRKELMSGLKRLLKDCMKSTKVLIFVDGLDEYEGDHDDLVMLIKSMSSSNNVKLCIASRPWNVFETAFGHDEMFKIYLQDFNAPDIRRYVKNMLEDRPDFQAVRTRDGTAEKLAKEVVSRSQGVFLWVFLVVRSLIQGLQNRDRIPDLQRRLTQFPSDLDAFFGHILMSLDETYRIQCARVFQMALSAPRTLSTVNYWFADMDELTPDYLSEIPTRSVAVAELRAREDEMRHRMNGRCKGLLEVNRIPDSEAPYDCRVDFLHRTVKDFLRTTDIQQQLKTWSVTTLQRMDSGFESMCDRRKPPAAFDPYQTICKATLAELRVAPIKFGYLKGSGPTLDLINIFFYCAQQHELVFNESLGGLLDLLDRTVAQHARDYPTQQPKYPWINWGADDLLCFAIRWNLCVYVKDQLKALSCKYSKISSSEKLRLLKTALQGRFSRNGDITRGPDPHMVEMIASWGPTVRLEGECLHNIASSLPCQPGDGSCDALLVLSTSHCVKLKPNEKFWSEIACKLPEEEENLLRNTISGEPATKAEAKNLIHRLFRSRQKK
jgi:hypothetical protein